MAPVGDDDSSGASAGTISAESDSGVSLASLAAVKQAQASSGVSVSSTSSGDGSPGPVEKASEQGKKEKEEEELKRAALRGSQGITQQEYNEAIRSASSGTPFRKEPQADGSIHHVGGDGEKIIETGNDKKGYQFEPQIESGKMTEPYICTVKIPTKDGKDEEMLHFNSAGKLISVDLKDPSQSKLDQEWLNKKKQEAGIASGASVSARNIRSALEASNSRVSPVSSSSPPVSPVVSSSRAYGMGE